MTLDNGEMQEKPYELIEFVAGALQRQAGVGHEALHTATLSGQFELYLIARTPVQVANGSFDVAKTRQGEEIVAQGSSIQRYGAQTGKVSKQPLLPGSSIKGMVRSLLETIASCCVATVAGAIRREIPSHLARCTKVEQLCPACRLFGMSGSGTENYQGQVSIEDAVLIDGSQVIVRTPLLWAPAQGGRRLPPRYLRGNAAIGRKVYYPSLPALGPDARVALKQGSTLRTQLHFANLTAAEMGLLIAALGLHPDYRFIPKIGGGKPVGLGSVETYLNQVLVYGDVKRTGRLGGKPVQYSGDDLANQLKAWTQAATAAQLLNETALHAVAEVLHLRNLKRPPVEGMY